MKRLIPCVFLVFTCLTCKAQHELGAPGPFEQSEKRIIKALNNDELAKGDITVAILGALLIDGTGNKPIANSMVIVEKDKIAFVGKSSEKEKIPENAKVIDAKGMTLLPGLIDAHFHGASEEMTTLFLQKGITSVRDPGAWNATYDKARNSKRPIPRLFLTGPHIDQYPPAYPKNSYLIQDPFEGQLAVRRFAEQGATAVKVYFRLSVEMIGAICEEADKWGLPVVGHLEITHAQDAIEAGLDGIEHVTSFGTALQEPRDAEIYKNRIMADNSARRRGRYEVWNSIDIKTNHRVAPLIEFLIDKKTFVCPTLAIFERQYAKADSLEVNGFRNMLDFIGELHKGGTRVVVGSHTWVPYAAKGDAYYREMELLKDAGLTNMQVIQAATLLNAEYFRIQDRLGSIEEGKIADLIILEENPLENLKAMRTVNKVMLNGIFFDF